MSLLSTDDLKALVEPSGGFCVSLYMPAQRLGSETQQNPIRFKNLIRAAEERLQETGMSRTEAVKFLKPATELDYEDFWQHQDEGLAVFIADGFFRYYQLPIQFKELAVVTDRFHLKPLMPLLIKDGEFFVLTLNQEQIRLFRGSRYSINEIELENVPKSMDEALQYDETAKDGQFRIQTNKGGTNNPFPMGGSLHGQGSPDRDDIRQDLLQFFHLVDRGLHEYFRDERIPLVIGGVDYLIPIYREANTYQHLIAEAITENVDRLDAQQLHHLAWPLVEPYFSQAQQDAIGHYRELVGTGKTSTTLEETVPAAYYGRIDQLFVAVGVQQWGQFNPITNELHMHPDAEPGDQDLLDSAAIQTLLNGGTVYAVTPDEVPDSAPLAAVFRY